MSGNGDLRVLGEAELRSLVSSVLGNCPIDSEAAGRTASVLVETDLLGIASHGVQQLPRYADMLKSGAVDGFARPEIVLDGGAIMVVDAHHGMGQFATGMAVDMARAKLPQTGLCLVAVRNSNHFGAAFPYCADLAEAGYVSFMVTNAPPNMAPWGGRDRRVGNNPFAWGVPRPGNRPVVLDIACSVAAGSRLAFSEAVKGVIPEEWALDEAGAPTTDPRDVHTYLPVGKHKGYGLALINEVLAGVLTGALFSLGLPPREKLGSQSWDVGHLLIAFDPARLCEPDALAARMDELAEMIASSRLRPGFDEVLLPGELEYRTRERRLREGIPLPAALVESLESLARGGG